MFQQGLATLHNVTAGSVKVSGIPRIGNVPLGTGKGQKFGNLPFGISSQDLMHIADIGAVHADEVIVFGVIGALQLNRALSGTADAVLRQLCSCGRVDGIAGAISDLL